MLSESLLPFACLFTSDGGGGLLRMPFVLPPIGIEGLLAPSYDAELGRCASRATRRANISALGAFMKHFKTNLSSPVRVARFRSKFECLGQHALRRCSAYVWAVRLWVHEHFRRIAKCFSMSLGLVALMDGPNVSHSEIVYARESRFWRAIYCAPLQAGVTCGT